MLALLEKRIRIVLEVRSRTSKFCIDRHMVFSVQDSASILTRRFVKSLATNTLLLFSTSGAKGIV